MLTESDLLSLLRDRHDPREWALVSGLRNGTGYSRGTTRTADAVALNLWPSRGLALHGFEVKLSRRDWLRELKNPAKADEIAVYCDFWWLVVSDVEIVKKSELPFGWGLLAAETKGDKHVLRSVCEPAKRNAKPLDREMIAAFCRCAVAGMIPESSVARKISDAFEKGQQTAADIENTDHASAARRLKELQETVAGFEAIAGVRLNAYSMGNIAKTVRAVVAVGSLDAHAQHLAHQLDLIRRAVAPLEAAVDAMQAAVSTPSALPPPSKESP